MIPEIYLETVSGEKQVALYKRLCCNVKGVGDSLAPVVGKAKDLEIKKLIKQYVDNGISEEKAIGSIITKYNLSPVGVKSNPSTPKKRSFNSIGVKTEIVNILSPKNSQGQITTGMGGALEALKDMMGIKGPSSVTARKMDTLIDDFMNKHPELDTREKVSVGFLVDVGAIKPIGGNRYQQTEKWKTAIRDVCKRRGVASP